MLIQKETHPGAISISAYEAGCVTVSGTQYTSPIVVTTDTVSVFEGVLDFALLESEHLLNITPDDCEILILGSGVNHAFLPPGKIKPIIDKGIAVECMSTRNACHTFQVLNYEHRKVVVLLFPE